LGFGYSPHLNIWIKVEIFNNSNDKITKIIEYESALTSSVEFFDNLIPIKWDGYNIGGVKESIFPYVKITLKPKEKKTIYIKAHSDITTLIVKLNLLNKDYFLKKEQKHQFILAFFLGAIIVIISYNFIIFITTRNIRYLLYVLFFLSISFHNFLYKGIAKIFIEGETLRQIMDYATFIVALPALFIVLFTQHMLELKTNYPKLNKIINYATITFIIATLLAFFLELHKLRSLFVIIYLLFGLYATIYAFIHKNRQAKFIIIGWFFYITSALLMYLSSLGIFEYTKYCPYYVSIALILEALVFSLSLADKIKQLEEENIKKEKEQKKELEKLVKIRTKELEKALDEKELLLKELNHRVKNSIQTILTFLRMQIRKNDDQKTIKILNAIKDRVYSIDKLYELLHIQDDIYYIRPYEYFSLLTDYLESNFYEIEADINIDVDINLKLKSNIAIYLGFILNEALTNSFKYAFKQNSNNKIDIKLKKVNKKYIFIIKDNGIGYNINNIKKSIGLTIIETIALEQLEGSLKIETKNGVTIQIIWSEK
jgi:two-component sensor histidine kinase